MFSDECQNIHSESIQTLVQVNVCTVNSLISYVLARIHLQLASIRCPIQAPRLFRKHISVATRNWGIRHIRPANPPMPSFNVSLSKTQSIHGSCVFIIQGDTKEKYVKSTPPIIHAGLIRVCYLAVRRPSLACSRWPVPSYFPSRTYLSVCWPGTG